MWQLNLTILAIALMIFTHTTSACASEETEQEQILRISHQALSNEVSLTAPELHAKISANDTSYYIISLQSSDEFAKGHIPGATSSTLITPTRNQPWPFCPATKS